MTGVSVQDHAEIDRIAALEACAIMDTPPDPEFDFLAHLAAEVCDAAMAGITFIDGERQFYKSAVGMVAPELPRDQSFCQHTIASADPMVVENALADDRFSTSPLVTGGPEIRFYAGAPLQTRDGAVLGALCVMDAEPRELRPHQLELLKGLARQVTALVEQRRDEGELRLAINRLDHDERLAHVGAWEWDYLLDNATWTPELRALFGVGDEVKAGFESYMLLVHEEDRDRVKLTVQAAIDSGRGFSYRTRIVRPDGEERTIDSRGETLRDSEGRPLGMRGATVDVTELVEAERRNRTQAAGLRAAFETALDPILIADAERRYVNINQAACTLLGYSREQLLGMRVEDLLPEEGRGDIAASWESFVDAGRQRGEMELVKADGSRAVVEFSATANFVPGRHLSLLRDVTERREAEREALESRRRLEETQTLTQVGSWEWDLGSDPQIMSDELMRILGRGAHSRRPSREEFIGYLHPDDRASFDRVVQDALRSTKPYRQVFRVITETGEVRTIESHGRVKVDKAGKPVRMVGAAQDITERERVAHKLRVQASVLDRVPAGVVASDTEARITQWSHGAEELFGISAEAARGRRFDELGLIPSRSQGVREAMTAQLGRGAKWEGEVGLRARDGRTFPALVTNSPMRNEGGEIAGYVGVIMDLTERQTIEDEVGLQGHLLDQVEAAVIATDLANRITHWNRGAEKLYGWSALEALGRLAPELNALAGDPDTLRDSVTERTGDAGSWEGEIEVRRKDGSTFPAFATNSTVRDPSGEITGYVGVSVDITEPQRAEEEARDAQLETIKRLATAVEERDPETGGHIERIGNFAAMIAERLGMDADRVRLIRVSSTMHDVGKVGIADDILLKPGKLTDEEREVMQTHTSIGHHILAGSGADLLDLAASIALTHHEHVDGGGYPAGVSGKDIPVEGRIVAVADVFDALTSDRVYRKAFSVEKAIEIMEEGRGSQFDPKILDVLVENLESFTPLLRRNDSD
jgi:PAS domain S-box-containing protein